MNTRKQINYSLEDCTKEGLKFNNRTEFKVQSGSIYSFAYKMGWLEDCCSHMNEKKKSNHYWTKERCIEAAKNYISRTDFSLCDSSAYSIASKNNWLDEICAHMPIKGDKKHRAIYAYEFQDQHAYIGLSYNIEARKQQHLSNQSSPVYKHIKKSNVQFILRKLTDYIPITEAAEQEDFFLNEYKKNGWLLLNTSKAGALGGTTMIWTFDKCLEEALEYTTRKEFSDNSPGAYGSARKNKWLDKICLHMKNIIEPRNHWNEENCRIEALKYNTRTEFHKKSGSAYLAAQKMGISETICSHMTTPIKASKWTKEKCQIEALKYTTKREFKKKSSGAYDYAYKKKILQEICTHMKSHRKPNGYWTKERCLEEAKKYNTRTEFQKGTVSAYREALNNNWIEEVCSHMIIITKPKNYWTKERCKQEAIKYSSRVDFQKMSNGPYSKSCRAGWIDEICAHMIEIKKPNNYWTKEKCKEEAIKYKRKIDFRKKAKMAYIKAFREGWLEEICLHMQQRRTAGFWTKEKIIEEASKYSTRSQFNKKSAGASTVARGYGWYDEIWNITHPLNS